MQRANLGLSDDQILLLMREADANNDGDVSYKEFLPLALELIEVMEARNKAREDEIEKQMWAEQEAMEMEQLYAPEFEAVMDKVAGAFTEADPNSTGFVSAADFLRILKADSGLPAGEINMINAKIGRSPEGLIDVSMFKDVALEVR